MFDSVKGVATIQLEAAASGRTMPATRPQPIRRARTAEDPASAAAPANPARDAPLTREQIVDAAITWIDHEGMASFSMRRFASSLGISGPALYWHFRNRDDLLNAAAEQVLSAVDSEIERSEPWETAVRRMMTSVWDAARAHPGLLDILRTQPLHIGAGQRLMQSLLVTLRGAGLAPEIAVDHTRALLWTTFGFIRGTAATLERVDGGSNQLRLDLSQLDASSLSIVAECVPRLATLDIDGLFRHTLDLMIAGISPTVPGRPRRRSGGSS